MIVADFSRSADNAVAWNEERYRILAHSRTYRTAGTRIVDARGNVSVGGHSAHRNLQQCLPHLHLKLRTLQIQLYLAQSAPVLRENEQDIPLYIVERLPEPCAGEPPLQGAERLHTVVGELHAANAFRSRSDKYVAERRRGETVIDKKILPAVFVLAGRHALDGNEQVVQPSRTGQSHLLRRVEKRCVRLVQDTLGIFDIEVLQEMLRRNPCPFFENPLKMERTHIHRFGYDLQTGLFLAVIPYEPDGFGNPAIIQFVLYLFHTYL